VRVHVHVRASREGSLDNHAGAQRCARLQGRGRTEHETSSTGTADCMVAIIHLTYIVDRSGARLSGRSSEIQRVKCIGRLLQK